jgi:hypothetical protein
MGTSDGNKREAGAIASHQPPVSLRVAIEEYKMTVTIKIFHVGLERFRHVVNTRHDSVELRDERDGILLNYAANARVTNHEGLMGNFYVEYVDGQPRWVYYDMPLQTRTVFGPDLPTAELELSRRYIDSFNATATEHGQLGAQAFVPC